MAAGIAAHTDLNPVLLKPTSDRGAQVIIHGKARTNLDARAYHDYKPVAFEAVLESHARLQARYDTIFVEGAGSPAEINLRDRDIANMGFAEAVDCPVVLVADIDRGGVFAHLAGTLACLSASEQARVRGFIINRFRGDIGLLQPGLDWLEAKTGKPVLGVLPYLHGLTLDAEDMLPPELRAAQRGDATRTLRVVVPVLPRISNHTDFDALRAHPQVDFHYVRSGIAPPPADLDHSAGFEERARRSRVPARARLGRGARAASALWRSGDRHLRRHADAGARGGGSAWRGRRAGDVGGTGLARLLDGADAREDAQERDGPPRARRRARPCAATRSIWATRTAAALARRRVRFSTTRRAGRRGVGGQPDPRDLSARHFRYARGLRRAARMGGGGERPTRSTIRRCARRRSSGWPTRSRSRSIWRRSPRRSAATARLSCDHCV